MELNLKIKSKRGDIGATITWVVAFLIIVFILLVYVVFVGVLAGKKNLPLVGNGANQITIMESQEDLELQRRIFFLFDYEAENGKKVKDLIYLWVLSQDSEAKNQIKGQIGSASKVAFENDENEQNECYLILIDGSMLYKSDDYFGLSGGNKVNSVKMVIFSENQKINFEALSSKC